MKRRRGVADGAETGADPAPITKERLRICCESARYWAIHLPAYVHGQQNRADRWAIAAGLLAAITGLAIFPTAQYSNGISAASLLVAVGAFLSATFALVPRVKNYGDKTDESGPH